MDSNTSRFSSTPRTKIDQMILAEIDAAGSEGLLLVRSTWDESAFQPLIRERKVRLTRNGNGLRVCKRVRSIHTPRK